MRWDREEYISLLTYGGSERPMFTELFGLLQGLERQWREQGASDREISLEAFDFDYVRTVWCGGECGLLGGYTPETLEETAEYVISRDEYGRRSKLIKGVASLALPLEYPVRDMQSWLEIKPKFIFDENNPDARIDWEQVELAKKEQSKGVLVYAAIPGGFDLPRELMGDELACICYYENPELMDDIVRTITHTAVSVLSRISEKLTIDNLTVHEDMAGKNGPLAGPKQVYEFIAPYYRSVWDMLRSRGTRLFSQDSDGNIEAVIPAFVESGLNVTYPCEPAAGMDIVALRKQYGNKLAFKGGIDKHVLRGSKAGILKELEYKLQPAMREGNVFGLDHRITNNTPLVNYRYYVKTAREILGLKPADPKNGSWERMAF